MSATNTGWRLVLLDAPSPSLTVEAKPITLELVSPGPQGPSGAAAAVLSVNGQSGTVVLGASDVGAAEAVHGHAISDVSGLQTALDGKASTSHTHAVGDITGLGTAATRNAPTAGNAGSSEVVLGNDSRLSNARTPTAHAFTHSVLGSDPLTAFDIGAAGLIHTHGNITNGGAIGSTSGLPIRTGSGGVLEAGAFGTTAGTFCAGDDARLSPQTITLTGDVTGSGTGSFAATIPNDTVTYAKMQNVSATDRLLGRSSAGAGDIEEIVCTAYARGILDDADAATARTTLGLGTTDTPTFTALILQNGEEIRNTTDGRIDLLPKPNAANEVGITFNMVQRSNIVSVGTLRTSNGVLNDGSVQWDVKQLIGNNVDFVVSTQDWSAFRQVVGTGLKQTLAVGVSANFDFGGTDVSSGAVAIMHRFHMGQANRTPSTTHVDPHLYIYSQDNTQANDFVRFSHNQTDGVIETGAGDLNLVSASGNINNNGNRIPKVFSGTTPPGAGTGSDGDIYIQYT